LFAKESDDATPVKDFLGKWNIRCQTLKNADLETFVAANDQEHLFDVSNDAATGYMTAHNIVKISGTNLVQQTDRSIARYHVPVILFDHGSGSRAAFAAYWLQTMGFSVSIVHLTARLDNARLDEQGLSYTVINHVVFSTEQLLKLPRGTNTLIDMRSSQAYMRGHLSGSVWGNISELIVRDAPPTEPVVVIGDDVEQAVQSADLLLQQGWQIDGIYGWNASDIDQEQIQTTTIESPIDKSAVFGGRHHGDLQDSRDYLAWEEELPDQIDPQINQLWLQLINKAAV